MRVLICGGRDFAEFGRGFDALDALHARHAFTLVIEGGAKGGDACGRAWAHERNIPVQTFEADWSLGRGTGPIRNVRMLTEGRPELVVAFPGGRGTDHMCRIAREGGVRVVRLVLRDE